MLLVLAVEIRKWAMKPKVDYVVSPHNQIAVGHRAVVEPINHPDMDNVSNNGPVLTSVVVSHNIETGEFETENTCYKPSTS